MPCPQQFRISPTNRNHHEDSDFNHQEAMVRRHSVGRENRGDTRSASHQHEVYFLPRQQHRQDVQKDTDVPESAWDSDKGVDTVVNSYDAIRFWVGYAPNRPGALVEVKGAELVEIRDEETKEPIVYEYEGNLYTALEIDYFLGKIIEK